MRPSDGQLEDVRHLVGMLARQEIEERAQLSGRGLEQRDDLARSLDRPLPMVGRVDGESIDASGEPKRDGGLADSPSAGVIRESTVDDPEDPFRPADLVGEGAHATTSSGTRAVPSEKSSTWNDRSVSRTSAARAGTGEMFRIR
jgi:hypothetical protein